MNNEEKEKLPWQPYGKICLKCGAQNPDGHDICGGCGEQADEFKEEELSKEQHEERNAIKKALR